MSGEAERPWWATNGESFIVRDLSMHSNVTRSAKPEKNPERKFFMWTLRTGLFLRQVIGVSWIRGDSSS